MRVGNESIFVGDLLGNCLFFTANRLARAITRMAEEAFAPTGLSPQYGFILMLVAEKEGIRQSELAGYLHLTPSTVTRFLDKLEAKRYLTRQPEGKNVALRMTPEGRRLLEPIYASWERLFAAYSSVLGMEKSREIPREMEKASSALEKPE